MPPERPDGPNALLIIGAQKAGTSYLHNLLVQNGAFKTARTKEPHYFSSARRRSRSYLSLFSAEAPSGILLDSSTSYLHNPATAPLIAAELPRTTPIVAVFRDPPERARSAWFHLVKHGCETRSFEEIADISGGTYSELRSNERSAAERALRFGRISLRVGKRPTEDISDRDHDDPLWNFCYLSNSLYEAQVAPFRARFPNLLCINFLDLIEHPEAILRSVFRAAGCPAPLRIKGTGETNKTAVSKRHAVRKYVRNIWHEAQSPSPFSSAAIAGSLAILRQRLVAHPALVRAHPAFLNTPAPLINLRVPNRS